MSFFTARFRYNILVLTLLLSAGGCKHKPADVFPNGWTKMEFSQLLGSAYREQAMSSRCIFHFTEQQNQVQIARSEIRGIPPRQDSWTVATSNGILHSEDHGEWGGDLWWSDAQGGQRTNLLHASIDEMVEFHGKVVVFSGFQYNDLMEHPVYLYTPAANGPGSLSKLKDAGGIPYLVAHSKNDLLILTHQGIVRMDANFQLTRLVRTELSPDEVARATSMARDAEGRIYLGLRGFVVRITPTRHGSTEEWFTQQGCLRD